MSCAAFGAQGEAQWAIPVENQNSNQGVQPWQKANAQRQMQQALAFANLVDAVVPCVRYAISHAGRAMDMFHGLGGRRGGGARAANAVDEAATARHSELNAIGLNH